MRRFGGAEFSSIIKLVFRLANKDSRLFDTLYCFGGAKSSLRERQLI